MMFRVTGGGVIGYRISFKPLLSILQPNNYRKGIDGIEKFGLK